MGDKSPKDKERQAARKAAAKKGDEAKPTNSGRGSKGEGGGRRRRHQVIKGKRKRPFM